MRADFSPAGCGHGWRAWRVGSRPSPPIASRRTRPLAPERPARREPLAAPRHAAGHARCGGQDPLHQSAPHAGSLWPPPGTLPITRVAADKTPCTRRPARRAPSGRPPARYRSRALRWTRPLAPDTPHAGSLWPPRGPLPVTRVAVDKTPCTRAPRTQAAPRHAAGHARCGGQDPLHQSDAGGAQAGQTPPGQCSGWQPSARAGRCRTLCTGSRDKDPIHQPSGSRWPPSRPDHRLTQPPHTGLGRAGQPPLRSGSVQNPIHQTETCPCGPSKTPRHHNPMHLVAAGTPQPRLRVWSVRTPGYAGRASASKSAEPAGHFNRHAASRVTGVRPPGQLAGAVSRRSAIPPSRRASAAPRRRRNPARAVHPADHSRSGCRR